MSENREHTPHWLLERLAAGELPEAQARELRERMGASVDVELEQIARSNSELLEQHPPVRVAREVERRLARKKEPKPVLWLVTAAAAISVMALWVVQAPAPDTGERVTERGLRPQLIVYRKTPQGIERLADRAHVRSGELLQIAYVSAGRKYGVVASIDGRGAITFHLPERAASAVPLHDQGESALPHAFELDDTPGVERFVFVSADEPFPTQVVADSLRTGAPLGSVYSRSEIALEKTP